MAQVLIRNLSNDALAAHRARAKAKGQSLEQALRELIEAAAPYSAAERLALVEHLQAQTPPGPRTNPAKMIREDRGR
jgi:antitoxin FitA